MRYDSHGNSAPVTELLMPTFTNKLSAGFKPGPSHPCRHVDEADPRLLEDSPGQRQLQDGTGTQSHALIEKWDAEHGEWIVERLQRRGFSFHDAEDAKQEALRREFQRRLGGGDMPRSVRGWLFTVALNAAKDGRRKRRREDGSWQEFDELAVASGEADPLAELCRGEVSDAMNAVIEKLTLPQKYVIRCYFYTRMSRAEIARSRGISEAAVARMLIRAMNNLRKQLSEVAADVTA